MPRTTVYEAVPQFGRLRNDVLYGDVWNQPELGKRDRSLVTCAILAALGNGLMRDRVGSCLTRSSRLSDRVSCR
ncbi:MAG TPA: carboxymuconolactone decarboxylase family protein [Candidatus Tectomicrobia bacterium]|nr:carboxymuconolactone decarboxylase family protein [Candidatus Tectomicrobia bacterium]